jgi:hypothetical protein
MPTASERPRLSDADLSSLLTLLKGAGSVELKLTVPDSERRPTVMALGLDLLEYFSRSRSGSRSEVSL